MGLMGRRKTPLAEALLHRTGSGGERGLGGEEGRLPTLTALCGQRGAVLTSQSRADQAGGELLPARKRQHVEPEPLKSSR